MVTPIIPHLRKGNRQGWLSLPTILVILLLTGSTAAPGQVEIEEEVDLSIVPEQSISPELAAWLDELRRNPIDLREATIEELSQIPGISPATAERILTAVDSMRVDSVSGLIGVVGIDDRTLAILQLFTTLGSRSPLSGWNLEIRTRTSIDLQEVRGFRDTLRRLVPRDPVTGTGLYDTVDLGPRFIAPPGTLTTRVLASRRNLRFGLIVDRDPGEPLLYSDSLARSYAQNEKVDGTVDSSPVRSGLGLFLSGFVRADLGAVDLTLGDYSLSFGSGLLFGRPFAGRKGGSATGDPFLSSGGIRPWTSRSESGYFRGGAARVRFGSIGPVRLQGSAFASRRFHDGSVRFDDSGAVDPSIDEAGLLATRTDLRRDDRIEERFGGIRIDGSLGAGRVGITVVTTGVLDRMTPDATTDRHTLASVDGTLHSGPLRMTFESALARSGCGIASGIGIDHAGVDATLAFRHFSPTFDSPWGRPFAESPTNPAGETGLYAGLRLHPVRRLTCEFFLDLYRVVGVDPTWPFPSVGSDLMSRIRWRPVRDLEVEGVVRFGREEGVPGRGVDESGREIVLGTSERSTTARIGLLWRDPDRRLALRVRSEYRADGGSVRRTGTLTSASLRWNVTSLFRTGLGWTMFDGSTPSGSLYIVEQDLPGGMSLATLSGRGRRYYILALWSPTPLLDLGIRYGGTTYADREVIRPGSTREITGRTASTLTLQVDWRP